jgi:hypothetical protein
MTRTALKWVACLGHRHLSPTLPLTTRRALTTHTYAPRHPTQELVQHRVRLQAPAVGSGGQLRFCAQWEMPPHDSVQAFRITAAGITMA